MAEEPLAVSCCPKQSERQHKEHISNTGRGEGNMMKTDIRDRAGGTVLWHAFAKVAPSIWIFAEDDLELLRQV